MRRFPLLTALALATTLAACESNTDKAQRLRRQLNLACIGVDPPLSTYRPTEDQRAKCDAAKREYNRFVGGR